MKKVIAEMESRLNGGYDKTVKMDDTQKEEFKKHRK
jgi:hypothetical protein